MEQDIQSLYHAVEITNNAEKAYVMNWLEAQGLDSSKLEGLFKFPMLIFTTDGTWMTKFERLKLLLVLESLLIVWRYEMVKTEDNRTLFIKLIDWLLTKFPNDPTLISCKSCKYTGHNWESYSSRHISKYSSYKTRRNYYKCSKCGKERKNL